MNLLKAIFCYRPPRTEEEISLDSEKSRVAYDVRREEETTEKTYVSGSIDRDGAYMKRRFSIPDNNDLVFRELTLAGGRRAFVIFIDGMVSTTAVNFAVIAPLLSLEPISGEELIENKDDVMKRLVFHDQAMKSRDMDVICEEINFGGCAVFVDGIDQAFSFDVRSWGTRSVSKPENEQSIYGPQEAFVEMLRTNSALIRKILKTENLIAEGVKIGSVSKTRGVLMYISGLADKRLVDEARRRINGIETDYIFSIEEVSMMIEEHSLMITSQSLATERPDRAARALSEGRVVLLLNGSPKALIIPANAFEFLHTPADGYMRTPYAAATRLVRMMAMLLSLLLPSLYLAITLYHQEMIPTYLLYSISAARENVPFPTIVELLIMDISFELIREAGIRMPGSIGSTLGIVGGIILGQAAVLAKIVSPIMIIIIAVTGIGSFASSDYSLGWSYRILRLIFIMLAAVWGFYGIAVGIFVYSVFIGSKSSFGTPFVSPSAGGLGRSLFVSPIWKREMRPEFLSPQKKRQEPRISEKWRIVRRGR